MNGLVNSRVRTLVALGAAVWMLGATASGAPLALSNGVPVSGLSGTIGSETFYTIVVPAGQDDLEIQITGGTGDCDLYVRRNAPPTMTTYDYRPYDVGSEETVLVESPAAGTWYIMLRGYTAYSGLTLVATYSATVSITPLTNGMPVSGLSATTGTETLYQIDVPAGQTKLEIQIAGGTGDCDLYVKRGAVPTKDVYDYRPYRIGNNETVTVDNPTAGTWYIMLRAYSTYTGVTLMATHSGGLGITLTNGVPVPNLSGAMGSETLYRIDVPAGQGNLEIKIAGGTGDCDLYVKYASPPTTSEFDYRPFKAGNDETVTVTTPTAGAWYIMLRGYSPYSGVTLLAGYGSVYTLENGVPVPDLSGIIGSEKIFKIDLPSGETEFEISISGGSGNCDLYVRRGLRPTLSDWDYRPYLAGNNETVSLSNPQGGTWYIMLRARQAYANVTLYAEHAFIGNVTLLSNGVPVTNTTGAEGSKKYYRLLVPSGQDELEIKISGGTGDADLYIKLDAVPTLTEYDYRPYQIGNNETQIIADPPTGNWLFMVHAYHAYTGLTVVATYTENGGGGPTVTPLTNGVPVTGLAGATGNQKYYKIDVPAGQSTLEIEMAGGSGDADLYVRKDHLPTLTEWDHRPFLIGNDETVSLPTPAAGTYFILINAYQAYSGASLVATYEPIADPVTELTNGVPVTGLSGATDNQTFYKIVVPAGQDVLDFQMSGGTGDADMYIKKGTKPTLTSWDYRPYTTGNNETVHLDDPAAATWYIMIHAYQAYSGASLVATYGTEAVGNNFAVDPNCVALWRFEPTVGGLLDPNDSLGTNHLVNHNVDPNTTEYREGTASAKFVSGKYLSIADANLAKDFPLKSTGDRKSFSVCCWLRVPDNHISTVWSKFASGKSSFQFAVDTHGADVEIYLLQGSSDGLLFQVNRPGITLNPMKWYHLGFTYNDVTRSYLVRVWDAEADVLVDTKTGTFSRNISLTDAPWQIGKGNWNNYGWIDEMAVFNDILTPAEIDKIRQGTYGKP